MYGKFLWTSYLQNLNVLQPTCKLYGEPQKKVFFMKIWQFNTTKISCPMVVFINIKQYSSTV